MPKITDRYNVQVGYSRCLSDLTGWYKTKLCPIPKKFFSEQQGDPYILTVDFVSMGKSYYGERPVVDVLLDACEDKTRRLLKPVEFMWLIAQRLVSFRQDQAIITAGLAVILSYEELPYKGELIKCPILCSPFQVYEIVGINNLYTRVAMTRSTALDLSCYDEVIEQPDFVAK